MPEVYLHILPQLHLPAFGLGVQKVRLHIIQDGRAVKQGVVLKVQEQTAVVQIDRAHRPHCTVNDTAFCVNEAGDVFINFHPSIQQDGVKAVGHAKHQLLVRNARHDDPHVHPPVGGTDKGAALRGRRRRDKKLVRQWFRCKSVPKLHKHPGVVLHRRPGETEAGVLPAAEPPLKAALPSMISILRWSR